MEIFLSKFKNVTFDTVACVSIQPPSASGTFPRFAGTEIDLNVTLCHKFIICTNYIEVGLSAFVYICSDSVNYSLRHCEAHQLVLAQPLNVRKHIIT